MQKVLILTDGKAGHENQSRAFARALGCDADVFELHFKSRLHKAASYVLDRTLGLALTSLFDRIPEAAPGDYSAVIGTGSGTFYAAMAMAARLRVGCGVVLYPRGYRLSHFSCILAPSFDRPRRAPNVVVIPANLVANDAAFYEKGVAAFREKSGTGHAEPGMADVRPVAVIVGGPNKCSTMTAEWMKQQLDAVFAANRQPAAGNRLPTASGRPPTQFWVTTSRRTPAEVEAVVDSYPWDYKLLYSKDHFNPIPAFVKLAKRLYVTAESTGMLSEACTFGNAEVFALDNLNPGPHKFRRFVENLRADGYLGGNRKIDLSDALARTRELLL